MSIFFIPDDKRFILETANTEYAFSIAYDRFLMHEYYGNKRNDKNDFFKPRIKPFSVYADSTGYDFSLTDSFLEFPFFGCGDFAYRVKTGIAARRLTIRTIGFSRDGAA